MRSDIFRDHLLYSGSEQSLPASAQLFFGTSLNITDIALRGIFSFSSTFVIPSTILRFASSSLPGHMFTITNGISISLLGEASLCADKALSDRGQKRIGYDRQLMGRVRVGIISSWRGSPCQSSLECLSCIWRLCRGSRRSESPSSERDGTRACVPSARRRASSPACY